MFFVEYEVTIIDEDDNYNEKKCHGITVGESYAEAVENIEKHYGNSIECIDMLFMNEESNVYDFEDTREEYLHGFYKIKKFDKWW